MARSGAKKIKTNIADNNLLEFRLTYEGLLKAGTNSDPRAGHKHDIRRKFHPQLKRLWELNPEILETGETLELDSGRVIIGYPDTPDNPSAPKPNRVESLAQRFSCGDYQLVPLVVEELRLKCSLDILFLRPDKPGRLIESGNIDNRLKILFDALRIPTNIKELGGATPAEGEKPFFCLLQDDKLITHVSIGTDILLEPVNGKNMIDVNDVRLLIAVKLQPTKLTWANIEFI